MAGYCCACFYYIGTEIMQALRADMGYPVKVASWNIVITLAINKALTAITTKKFGGVGEAQTTLLSNP